MPSSRGKPRGDNEFQEKPVIKNLKKRAALIQKIRIFFNEKNILEVETPIMSHATVTDPHLASITTNVTNIDGKVKTCYLQTSPEFAMKRLLAKGSGAIYQITKSFRDNELGRFHNLEFTMLEWYRPGFDHIKLMHETDELIQLILGSKRAQKFTYQAIFEKLLNINPHAISVTELREHAHQHGLEDINGVDIDNKDTWLQRLMSDVIEPQLTGDSTFIIYDFPASQAALAKVRHEAYPVASRFEVYYNGIELANGFHELTDAKEQEQRFINDLAMRKSMGLPDVGYDKRLIVALEKGVPDCAGVALGIDRLIMLALNCNSIEEVISFTFSDA